MNADFSIREATLADIPEILRQRRAMYQDMGSRDEDLLNQMTESSATFLREAIPSGFLHAWLAENREGRSAGGGVVITTPWLSRPHSLLARQAFILNVYVFPEFRRRGIARALMQTTIDWCRKEGFSYVSLHASADGRPLYESMGFEPTSEMRLNLRR
jgi:GNAT superfamily N-acetyltransferase